MSRSTRSLRMLSIHHPACFPPKNVCMRHVCLCTHEHEYKLLMHSHFITNIPTYAIRPNERRGTRQTSPLIVVRNLWSVNKCKFMLSGVVSFACVYQTAREWHAGMPVFLCGYVWYFRRWIWRWISPLSHAFQCGCARAMRLKFVFYC